GRLLERLVELLQPLDDRAVQVGARVGRLVARERFDARLRAARGGEGNDRVEMLFAAERVERDALLLLLLDAIREARRGVDERVDRARVGDAAAHVDEKQR